jgi:hypothetical protein
MRENARAVADAVLYEGFLLFPYGKDALKNRMPFQFGVLMPRGYADDSEPTALRAEFVLCSGERIDGVLRFLGADESKQPLEREVPFTFGIAEGTARIPFRSGRLCGTIAMQAREAGGSTHVALEVQNETQSAAASRNEALNYALVSAHVLLDAPGGSFASLLDPPPHAAAAVAQCRNERAFPVLIGDEAQGTHAAASLLVSPIILYDFPRIAAASRTPTFDATEIDELLMLSVASLTDREKAAARAAHPFARELVERAEALDAGSQAEMHGELTGVTLQKGSRVRVLPKGRADVWDDVVRGMTARVNALHTDFEGKQYVAVLFEDDPASEMHEWYGRSFFYGVDEVEVLP